MSAGERDRVPDPLDFGEYATEEQIQEAIERDRRDYETWQEGRER